ncbi:MAG: hypothetical protein PXY39_12590 [archaeon]|nr:hypothetical protein [archaeon]
MPNRYQDKWKLNKPQVGDIEIVCIPKFAQEEQQVPDDGSLDVYLSGTCIAKSGKRLVDVNLLDRQLLFYVDNPGLSTQHFERGDNRGPNKNISAPFGERHYALKYKGEPLDLFVCLRQHGNVLL